MELPVDSARLKAWDHQYLWHPFTDMQQYLAEEPLVIWRGEGIRLQDVDGRWYYDGVSSIWLNVHGHRVSELDRAIERQLARLAHSTLLGQSNVPAVMLAERLIAVVPAGLKRVFYSDSGATAVEIAVKMAIQYWHNQGIAKSKILGFTRNYHGDTVGAMAVAPDPLFHWPFLSLLPENPRVPYPYCYRCPLGETYPGCRLKCLDSVEAALDRYQDELAAVIIEPVEGAGGMIPLPPGYLKRLREITRAHDVLLIVDEVATGFGRTGSWFYCEAAGVTPDILCLAKGITGGYLPLAATLATEAVFRAFLGPPEAKKTLFHGHSYTGNALASAVALANLELMGPLMETLAEKIAAIRQGLEPLADDPWVGDIRQAGFMVGIELVQDRQQKTPFAWERQIGWAVARRARAAGLLVRPLGSVVVFMPPLASTVEEIQEMLAILRRAIREVEEAGI